MVIKVDLKDNLLLEKQVKIPNANNALMSQAKYLMYHALLKNDPNLQPTEVGLSQLVTLLHTTLLKQREDDLQKQLGESGR